MKQRVNIEQSLPHAWKAMYALSVSLGKTSLTPIQQHLIKIRVSQINSCAFCINMHTKEALAIGETQQRIFVLSAWKETNLFTPEEKAILAITEEVTLIHQHGISDETYQQAEIFFSAETIGDIIMATISMNGWNRIAVSTHLQFN
ncbi:MAG: carboxymuconolactone decarboxylase family protein [Bacteroidota bacterium]